MSGRRTRQTPAEKRRPAANKKDGGLCCSCGQRNKSPTGRLCPAMISPIPDDVLNTQLGCAACAPPVVKPVRSIQESLNLFTNTCSDLVSNMAKLQSRVDVIDAEKEDRANQSWANLSNLQGRVGDNFQEAPPSRGLPKTLPSQQSSPPGQPVPILQPVTQGYGEFQVYMNRQQPCRVPCSLK